MKNYSFSLLFLFMASCNTRYEVIKLIPDNDWHNVYALQAGTSNVLDIKKSSKVRGNKSFINYSKARTQIRLLRLAPFQDLKNLQDTLPKSVDPDSDNQRTSDFGPQDISQDGSRRKVRLTAGTQLLSRSNQPNAVLLIKIK